MIGYRPRFGENGDLLPWLGSAAKRPPFLNERTLMTREIMRSRDAQCNTGNDLKRTQRIELVRCIYWEQKNLV